jgi:hypothetical protein
MMHRSGVLVGRREERAKGQAGRGTEGGRGGGGGGSSSGRWREVVKLGFCPVWSQSLRQHRVTARRAQRKQSIHAKRTSGKYYAVCLWLGLGMRWWSSRWSRRRQALAAALVEGGRREKEGAEEEKAAAAAVVARLSLDVCLIVCGVVPDVE